MNRIITLLISAILAIHGAFASAAGRKGLGISVRTESPEVRAQGRAACGVLLNNLGHSHLLDGVRETVVEDFANGVLDDQSFAVRSLYVSIADAEIVQLLSDALEEDVATASRLYTNSAMMIANALNVPGKLNYVIRLQSARGLLGTAGLPPAQVQAVDSRLRQILQQ